MLEPGAGVQSGAALTAGTAFPPAPGAAPGGFRAGLSTLTRPPSLYRTPRGQNPALQPQLLALGVGGLEGHICGFGDSSHT